MSWQDREKEEIKADEGLKLQVYLDTEGNPTAGYGHFDKALQVGTEISQQEADDWFETDFEEAYTGAQKAVPCFDSLDGPRKGVLVNMAFNMGQQSLSSFHGMIAALDSGDWDTAALHLMNSKYARQVKSRANRLAYRLRTDEYALRT